MLLYGRDKEQRAITELLSRARDGLSGALAIVGEPGMGKSALLAYAEEQATTMRVLRARGVQSETRVPFGGLFELLRPALGCLARIPRQQAAALEGALALGPTRAEDRFAVGAATLSLLAAFAEAAPLLVMVDDAHWVDGSTADALLFAARRFVADPIAVVISVREGEPSMLDGADLAQVRLEGLDRAAAASLLGTGAAKAVAEDVVERVHRQTGGNPLALLEAAGDVERWGIGPLDTPLPLVTSLSALYLKRTKALPSKALRMVLLAAASDTAELSTLARAARALDLEVADLEAAEEAGLVATGEGQLWFRHPLVRSAIYNDAPPGRRREAHRALAGALPDAEVDRRAWHLGMSVLGPDAAACSALEQAGTRARERSAYDVSSRAFERAAQIAPDDGWRSRLLFAAASSAWLAGLSGRALEFLDAAAGYMLSPELTVDVDHLRGYIVARHGPISEGQAILRAGADRAVPVDAEIAVVMLAEVVNAAFYAGNPSAMLEAGARIAAIAPDPAGRRCSFFDNIARGMALTFSGQAAAGAVLLRRAVALVEETNELGDDPTLLAWAAMGPLWLREADAGRALIERALDSARARAAIGVLPYLLSHVAVDRATTDRWSEAEAGFHEVITLAREARHLVDLAMALSRLAWLEARQGKAEESRAHATESIALSGQLGARLCEIWATAALGELALALGQPADALACFNRLQGALDECGIADVDLSPAPEMVELHLRSGRRETAREIASAFEYQAETKGQPWALARAARCRGLLAGADEMDHEFARALDFHAQTRDVFETARTRLAYGSLLRRGRQRARSRQQLRAAIQQFDALGAEPWSNMARAELAATGETARERNISTRYQLTPQELQIALLLSGGRTTREVASALFLSPKTVEYHLRSVYRKLGVGSRSELAAAMGASEAAAQPDVLGPAYNGTTT